MKSGSQPTRRQYLRHKAIAYLSGFANIKEPEDPKEKQAYLLILNKIQKRRKDGDKSKFKIDWNIAKIFYKFTESGCSYCTPELTTWNYTGKRISKKRGNNPKKLAQYFE